jgi:hypothetical protein
MSTIVKRSIDDQILAGFREWRTLNPGPNKFEVDDIADWLVSHQQYGLEKRIVRREISKRLSKALNRKHVRNEQGVRVKEFHAARLPVPGAKKQKIWWADRLTMEASFAHASFEQRQKQTEGMCRSMSRDATDVNVNNPNLKKNPVQLELDFRFVETQKRAQKVQTVPIDDVSNNQSLTKSKPH